MLMKFFSLHERSLFSIHDPTGVKVLTHPTPLATLVAFLILPNH